MSQHVRHHAIGLILTCSLWSASAETPPDTPRKVDGTPKTSTPVRTPVLSPWTKSIGLGLFHYREPHVMQLTGLETTVQLRYKNPAPDWPDVLQLDVGMGALRYSSETTGYLPGVPVLNGRGTVLWRLGSDEAAIWRAGLQADLVWTDLRGYTSTGHRGYRRLGSKAWAVLQYQFSDGGHVEAGGLLQGQQDSWLTDAGKIQNIRNKQNSGMYLAYQHPPLKQLRSNLRPWVRYSQVGQSDLDWNYYEPRNRTLQFGALLNW